MGLLLSMQSRGRVILISSKAENEFLNHNNFSIPRAVAAQVEHAVAVRQRYTSSIKRVVLRQTYIGVQVQLSMNGTNPHGKAPNGNGIPRRALGTLLIDANLPPQQQQQQQQQH